MQGRGAETGRSHVNGWVGLSSRIEEFDRDRLVNKPGRVLRSPHLFYGDLLSTLPANLPLIAAGGSLGFRTTLPLG